MKKEREARDPNSCFNRARRGEMVFVLLGRDVAAPHAIREWAKERIRVGKNTASDPQIREASECASAMEMEYRKRASLIPAAPDLYDALRELSDALEAAFASDPQSARKFFEDVEIETEWRDRCRQALAKARGEVKE
jgi:hypothetical protein